MTAQERAEELKRKGNEYFQRGKLHAAIDMYTEAIVMDPQQTVYFSNRALCHSKLENWTSCRDDCQHALRVDASNTKASYLLGVSDAHLLAFEESIAAFRDALHSAEKAKKTKAFREEILTELRRAKKEQWTSQQNVNKARHEAAKEQLALLFETRMELAKERQEDATAMEALDRLQAYVENSMVHQEKEFLVGEIPEYFICPVSMEIMQDPVTTPNGVSYERRYIEEHLRKNGAVDPLTRQRLTLDMLRPNVGLRAAIQEYLEKNPWAYEH